MFSSRKKPEPSKRRNHDLSQFGLMEIPDGFDPTGGIGDSDGGDSDLEAELAALAGKNTSSKKTKKLPVAKDIMAEIDKNIGMISEDDENDNDDDDEDLENNPDLMSELNDITGDTATAIADSAEAPAAEPEQPQLFLPTSTVDLISVIAERIEMYKLAEANAKATGEAGKARRFARGLKTLQDLHKQASAGKTIAVDEIPPELNVKPATPQSPGTEASTPSSDSAPAKPLRTAPTPPQSSTEPATPTEKTEEHEKPSNTLVEQMRSRQRDYKAAALESKRSGDTPMALQFLKVVKQFDIVIKMCEDGQEVDLSDMPPPPEEFKEFLAQMEAAAGAAPPADEAPAPTPAPVEPAPQPTEDTPPAAPSTILEALQQRLDKYKSVEESAKAEGNSSKARRFGRIVKQYEDAVKAHKAGRPVAYDELPVPPGFGPLPLESGAAPATAPKPAPASKPTSPDTTSTPISSPSATTPTTTPTLPHRRPTPQRQELTTRTSGNQQCNNLAEQQMKILLDRQKEFKIAALEAKKAGEIEQAKEYLKIYKGFDALLNAASSGLPVDLNTLPLPPSQRDNLEETFAIIASEEPDPDEDISDIGVRMEEQLAKQLMMCKNTRDHHKAMGDIAGMNRFENLAVTVQKDLDLVRYSKRKNYPLPKFHYEKRSFNIVHCNTDLTDSEIEIVVIKGMHYKVANPKDVDTYVKIEFPLLNDEIFKAKTNLIKDTDSPDYDQHFKVDIERGNRQFQRIFKRHGVKFEVYSRGGFLRSDILIGTVNVKLQPLETKCDIHDSFDLMEGRKHVGGKLEVKIRVRNPILTKQVEHVNEKWLVLDS